MKAPVAAVDIRPKPKLLDVAVNNPWIEVLRSRKRR